MHGRMKACGQRQLSRAGIRITTALTYRLVSNREGLRFQGTHNSDLWSSDPVSPLQDGGGRQGYAGTAEARPPGPGGRSSVGPRHKAGARAAVTVQDSLSQAVGSLSKCVQWAEGFLLVYSITDYDSYLSIRPLYQHIRKVHPDSKAPVIIVGNKGDLLHARQVQTRDGIQLANELGSLFLEISTSENYEDVCDVFQHLCKEVSKLHSLGGERRRASIIPRPRSPNMQDLKRRFKQALSSKAKAPSALG
ncbi:Ras-like protein family member 11A, partial [Eschrichtius robustus]|nr:Ras-like protein family member 11A [Eschrichtius robustus]